MSDIQYYTNQQGEKTSVIVPYQEWLKLNAQVKALQEKLRIMLGIQEALQEVRQARKSSKKLQTLGEFIHESRNQGQQ